MSEQGTADLYRIRDIVFDMQKNFHLINVDSRASATLWEKLRELEVFTAKLSRGDYDE